MRILLVVVLRVVHALYTYRWICPPEDWGPETDIFLMRVSPANGSLNFQIFIYASK
jgi:hypothetical protein